LELYHNSLLGLDDVVSIGKTLPLPAQYYHISHTAISSTDITDNLISVQCFTNVPRKYHEGKH